MPSDWGPWTEVKLDALERYLHHFTTVSQRAPRTLYLDLFAGGVNNRSRETGDPFAGSGERALRIIPPFDLVVLCEMNALKATGLGRELHQKYPGRVRVLPGDCNATIPAELQRLAREDNSWRYAPAFAFVDQFAAEIHWRTLEHLANFRLPTSRGTNRVELWLYLGETFLPRGLRVRGPVDPAFADRVDRMFGHDPRWRDMDRGRREGLLAPAKFKEELVNLMRWKLTHELGYPFTTPLQMVRADGQAIYTMIFATAHDAGDRIMKHVLQLAEAEMHEIQQARKARKVLGRREAFGEFPLLEVEEQLVSPVVRRALVSLDVPHEPWSYPSS